MSQPSLQRKRPSQRKRIRVLVADKNAHFRETIRRVASRLEGCVVSGEATSIEEVVIHVADPRIDLVLLDVEMVTQDRLRELKRLAKRLSRLKVAVLLSDDTPEYREAVQLHGGHFAVAKDRLEEELPGVLGILLHQKGQHPSLD